MKTASAALATLACAGALLALVPRTAAAQGTLEDYRRAATINRQYAGLVTGVVDGTVNWTGNGGQFWYRVSVPGGNRFVRADAEAWSKQAAFDHDMLAGALNMAAGGSWTAVTLPFSTFTYGADMLSIEADASGSRWRCTLTDYVCSRIGEAQARPGFGRAGAGGAPPAGFAGRQAQAPGPRLSPDGKWEAFIQNYNVAIRPAQAAQSAGGAPGAFGGAGGAGRGGQAAAEASHTMLSYDGSEGDAYQLMSIEWSPDSKKLVAYRRRPGYSRMVHYVRSSPTDQVQPKDTAIFYRKPGDLLDLNQPVLFDIEAKRQVVIERSLFPNAYQISRPVWRKDGSAWTFEYNQRGHQVYRVLEVNASTGDVRAVIDETTQSFFAYRETSPGLSDTGKNWRFDIDDGKEVLWMSERDGWNHIWLYDGLTGKVKNQVTKGPWVVKHVDSVDVANRHIYFRALGMKADQDPYFIHFYRIGFDGKGLTAFTEANGTHTLSWSPDRKYYVDSYSRVDLPTVTELRRVSDGARLELEKGDMSAAVAAGFRPPEVFVSKARDGKTDIWGIIVRPSNLDPAKKYPVLEQIYAGPQGSFVPKSWGGGQNLQATAELGFILVQIDGMGTNNRSKAFHDVAWKNLADAGFPDRILWHQAVNAKYPWYDITRVGVYGGSAGGQNAAGAVLFHPEFYDAAVASSGCHDNRMDKIWWNELWMGEMGQHYAASSNTEHAANLKGRLFLAVGEMDTNVDPSSTMQLVNALIAAGKDFELLVTPNGGHGAMGPDGNRRRTDFFIRALYGTSPPDWNAGARIEIEATSALEVPAPEPAADSPDAEGAPAYGFFESPADSRGEWWWW